jgi:uncharacterized membrane protein YqjE
MAENPASSPSGSLLDHLRELLAAGLEYFQARLTLAGIEAKEALLHFAIIIGLFVAALGVIIFGYLFLCIGLTVLLARLLGISPGWVILGLGVVHFAVAAGAGVIAATRLKIGVFTATLAELRKDQEWLNRK